MCIVEAYQQDLDWHLTQAAKILIVIFDLQVEHGVTLICKAMTSSCR